MNYDIEECIDIKGNALAILDPRILKILLRDKSREYVKHKNRDSEMKTGIIWATDDYVALGDGYSFFDEITVEAITGENGNVIRPRMEKSKEEQSVRSKEKAEVFTPSWVCNKQNNLVDNAWFGYEDVFNIEIQDGWIVNENKVVFPNIKGKTWKDYVKANRMEISCGEAPYLASRYDTVTGKVIPVRERIGLLDRKLRIVSENVDLESEWLLWATKAVQSIYGYDWQGDNVLLARGNILCTFAEHYEDKFLLSINREYLIKIAKVVSWNIWQMDGIKCIIPNSCYEEADEQLNLFGYVTTRACRGCITNDHSQHNGIYCRIYDWSANRSTGFYSFIKKGAR